MSNRITVTDVRAMFTRATRSAVSVGLDPTGWRLTEGSSTYGNSWKLDMVPSLGAGFGGNYLGMTAREAYHALEYMARAWEIVVAARESSTRGA